LSSHLYVNSDVTVLGIRLFGRTCFKQFNGDGSC
jgi:hypothetical protein